MDVTCSYGGPVILKDVSLSIEQGDFACAVGPNGGGKTTLLKVILGLLKPVCGRVCVLGGEPERNRVHIGYVPQRHGFDPLFPADVLDVVLMGRLGITRPWGLYRRRDKRLAMEVLAEVGMVDLRRHSFASLSGGQQQRVLIARALVCDPKILMLDEPTANLDVHMEGALYELLSHLNERMTVVLVSHDLGVVSKIVRTVICVAGKVEVHPTSELTGERVSAMYGGGIRMVRHDHHHHGGGHP
jgi:zinc transport system ATP-binding protein